MSLANNQRLAGTDTGAQMVCMASICSQIAWRGKWGGALLGPEIAADGVELGQCGIQGAEDATQVGFLIPSPKRAAQAKPGANLELLELRLGHYFFAEMDQPALRMLLKRSYEQAKWAVARVGVDYHVDIGGHYCSVRYLRCWISGLQNRMISSHSPSRISGLPSHLLN